MVSLVENLSGKPQLQEEVLTEIVTAVSKHFTYEGREWIPGDELIPGKPIIPADEMIPQIGAVPGKGMIPKDEMIPKILE